MSTSLVKYVFTSNIIYLLGRLDHESIYAVFLMETMLCVYTSWVQYTSLFVFQLLMIIFSDNFVFMFESSWYYELYMNSTSVEVLEKKKF